MSEPVFNNSQLTDAHNTARIVLLYVSFVSRVVLVLSFTRYTQTHGVPSTVCNVHENRRDHHNNDGAIIVFHLSPRKVEGTLVVQ